MDKFNNNRKIESLLENAEPNFLNAAVKYCLVAITWILYRFLLAYEERENV